MHLTPGAALRRCGYIPAGDEGAIPPSKRTPKMLDDAIDRGLIARGTDFLTSVVQSCTMALPPTSSVATLAGRRATVVQTPTANPIVVALPRVAVTTHCQSWGLADSRCEARWLLYEPRRPLDRAWRDSLPRVTSGDSEYR